MSSIVNGDSRVRTVAGKVGSGKSYYVVFEMLEALMRGEVVVTNIGLKWDGCERIFAANKVKVPKANYRFVTTAELESGPDKLLDKLCNKATVVLDELHLFTDARDWKQNEGKSAFFQILATQSRKYDLDIWLMAQVAERIDSRLSGQSSNVLVAYNWQHFPLLGSLLPFPLTLIRVCDAGGKNVLDKIWIKRQKKYYNCYDSKQIFKALDLKGDAASPVVGRRKLRSMNYGWILMCFGVCILGLDYYIDHHESRGLVPHLPASAVVKNPPVKAKPETMQWPSAPPPPRDYSQGPSLEPADSVLELEARLPLIHAVRPFYVSLFNGTRITPGVQLGEGAVVGWEKVPSGIIVTTTSTVTPKIHLYYTNGLRNLSCAVNGNSGGSISGGNPLGSELPVQQAPSHPDELAPDPRPGPPVIPAWAPAPPFIPR